MEIHVLHRQGKGVRAVARETGAARNTIRAILAGKSDGQYGPRQPRPSKIDGHKGYLQERIEAAGKIRRRRCCFGKSVLRATSHDLLAT